jgi:hypothetical protein
MLNNTGTRKQLSRSNRQSEGVMRKRVRWPLSFERLENRRLLTFTLINTPTAQYTGSTKLVPITIADRSPVTTLSDSNETISITGGDQALTVPSSRANWSAPPVTESATPRVIYDTGTSMTLTFSKPVNTFGAEVEPNVFDTFGVTATFQNGSTTLGTMSLQVGGQAGARLFGGTSNDQTFTSVKFTVDAAAQGFAIAEVRYTSVLVTVDAGTRNFTLMDAPTFKVDVTPSDSTAQYTYTIETKKSADPTFSVVSTSQSAMITQRLAGIFTLRASVTIAGVQFFSQQYTYKVQFPTVTTVAADAGVAAAMNTAWTSTKQYALNNHGAQAADGSYPNSKRHELGFYVLLDTSTGTYSETATVTGPDNGPTQTAGVDLGARPGDVISGDGLSAIYCVADFHTHTPMTYRTGGARAVGPSQADINDNNSNRDGILGLPGLVYDYNGTGGSIAAGAALDSPAHVYTAGPARRGTPRT